MSRRNEAIDKSIVEGQVASYALGVGETNGLSANEVAEILLEIAKKIIHG